MAFRTRIWLLGTVACAVVAISAPAAQGAFGVESFFAANCNAASEGCNKSANPSEEKEKAEKEGYTQVSGHPPFGITDFKINTTGTFPAEVPSGIVTHIRTDVAPGVSTNPEAVEKCTEEEFGKEAIPGTGFFPAPTCKPGTVIGTNQVLVFAGAAGDIPLGGTVYNLVQGEGLASEFGVALELPKPLTEHILSETPLKGTPAETAQYFAHTLIEGHVEWGAEAAGTNQGDFHDYFEINVSTALPLISSRLTFKGNIGTGGFLTNPSNCLGSGVATTSALHLEAEGEQSADSTYTTPIGTEGCNGLPPFALVPFEPTFSLAPETTQSDQPDGITTELVLPHDANPENPDSSQLKTATVTLPEGMTLNPSAAPGLQICTSSQIGITAAGLRLKQDVTCPSGSILGNVTLQVPGLPAGSLQGSIYLGGPDTGPITGSPYTVYVHAESKRYGVSVRLRGHVTTDETTGRVTATFSENPEQPFSDLILNFKGGALAPIANPLICGAAKTTTSLVPYTGLATKSPFSQFVVDGNGKGGACSSPLPFTLGQSTSSTPATGGSNTSFTFNLARNDGQQYLSHVSATLPAGLVGKIPAVPLCAEPQAASGACGATSQIGTATATVGSGPSPVQFTGPVYLTGPTNGAPYGMTTVINAAVGPFSFGNDVVRTGISVNPITARVTVAGDVPRIFKGIQLRLRNLSVAITKTGFLVNPTNCGALATDTTLSSSLGASQTLSTPFQATGCTALAFKPKFTASSSAKTSRANGASLNVKVGYPTGVQANIKSVLVTVPKQLPSRLSTLKKACLEATFNANPYSCPTSSRVGGATVRTPVLPGKLTGPAYFVSHGGAAFPDLDLVLSGDGVTVILVGNTNIQNGITTSNFAAVPDVPVTSFETNLPVGKNSAVTGVGNLCKQPLVMPTTITAQNGKVIKQNTQISVSGCPVTVLSRHVSKGKAVVTVKAPAAGRVSGGGNGLKTVYKRPGKAKKLTIEVPLSNAGRNALAANGRLSVSVRIGFVPKAKGKSSTAHTVLVFK